MADDAKGEYQLIVNKVPKRWSEQFITGSQLRDLAGSPANWIVNQKTSGPGADPEIGDTQRVDLSEKADPPGVKKFVTRKPTTTPGA